MEAGTSALMVLASQKCLLFSIITERRFYSLQDFLGTLNNHERGKGLASKSFYVYSISIYADLR